MTKNILLTAVLILASSAAIKADDSGLASIHEWRNEGGRICMSDHFHDGSGTGANRKAAEASAISSWMSFTTFEYGSNWGSFTLAASKKMDCSPMGASEWSCNVTARPCMGRPAAVSRRVRRAR